MKDRNDQSDQAEWWRMPLLALIAAALILGFDGERLAALVTAIASLVLWIVALLE